MEEEAQRSNVAVLAVAALGVVFGDIGTSPLYALRECFAGPWGTDPTAANVLGVLSLLIWTLLLIASVKYVIFVLRADNEGEGGILALLALVQHGSKSKRRWTAAILLGLTGAALLYGDGMLTPAISVLSAVEGTELAVPALHRHVVPITVAILLGLFFFQKRGTAAVGRIFGPVTIAWFLALAVLGMRSIRHAPEVLQAFDPRFGLAFLADQPPLGLGILGAVFLVVTGAEALYADMGHFGARAIRLSWWIVVLPSLLLNYLGQGALLLRDPTVENLFYRLAPEWALIPLLVLATAATIIASQAIITGAFSLTHQAIQLGYAPRLRVEHTSETERGQIYVPVVNWILMVGTVMLVVAFGTSSALAGAYGIAVAATMLITSLLLYRVMEREWGWGPVLPLVPLSLFILVEGIFLGANLLKFLEGGWVPVAIAAVFLLIAATWRTGTTLLGDAIRANSLPLDDFLKQTGSITRVRGHAVYMTRDATLTPGALVKNIQHYKVLHMEVLFLTIDWQDVPRVKRSERLSVEYLGQGFHRAVARYGFMERPEANSLLMQMQERGIDFPAEETTFFMGRDRPAFTPRKDLAPWRQKLFAFLVRNSQTATDYFRIAPDRVIEVGSRVALKVKPQPKTL